MEKVTVEQVQDAIEEHGIAVWYFRRCSICYASLSYIFDAVPEKVVLDTSCSCTSFHSPPSVLSYEHFIETTFNLQSKPEVRKSMWTEFISKTIGD